MRRLFKGFVYDGVSEPSRKAVLVENDTVIAIETDIYGSAAADKVYSFKNEIISPGFIDAHGHSDISLAAAPAAWSKRQQGFTREISGNCGLSPFPLTPKNIDHIRELYREYNIDISWRELPEYMNELSRKQVKMQLHPLCGHNTLRAAVAGYQKEELSDNDIMAMQTLLDAAMHHGAAGMSTGLLYTPGCFSSKQEIISLMKVLAVHDKVYATHLRSEGDQLLESLEETLECALQAHLKRVQISHFKTARQHNWHKLDAALKLIDHYRDRGIDIHIDRYPYVESQTMLSVILPEPYKHMGDTEITRMLADSENQKQLISSLRQTMSAQSWARLRLTGAKSPKHRVFAGKFFTEIPRDAAELTVEILADDATCATISAAGMSESNMLKIITQNYCMLGSDGYALAQDRIFGKTHPRSFGSAAKFIRILLELNFSIGNTLRKLTSMPADFFQLGKCGKLLPGYQADITVFDPEKIDSKADFTTPSLPAEGITLTMFNGEIME